MSRPILYLIWSFVAICASPQIHAQQGLVINEIMANPIGGQLPIYEYLEIYNNGNQVAQLSEYTLFIGNNRVALPQYRLAPRQYLLLCSETAFPAFQSFGNVVPLSTWYALNNSSATLKLVHGENLQDSVSYNDSTTTVRNVGAAGVWNVSTPTLSAIPPLIGRHPSTLWVAPLVERMLYNVLHFPTSMSPNGLSWKIDYVYYSTKSWKILTYPMYKWNYLQANGVPNI